MFTWYACLLVEVSYVTKIVQHFIVVVPSRLLFSVHHAHFSNIGIRSVMVRIENWSKFMSTINHSSFDISIHNTTFNLYCSLSGAPVLRIYYLYLFHELSMMAYWKVTPRHWSSKTLDVLPFSGSFQWPLYLAAVFLLNTEYGLSQISR